MENPLPTSIVSETSQSYTQPRAFSAYETIKRFFDFVLSLTALILFSPFYLLLAILIKCEDPHAPVVFKHKRVGHYGKPISIYKFRTMVADAESWLEHFDPAQKKEFEENYKLKDDPRITRIGRILRKTSLDELPQLWNIVKGDLSIVGPRPVVQNELEKYGMWSTKFLSTKPGLTGYWQASGRSDVTYDQRMEMELYYIDHKSLWLDIKILLKTVWVVIVQKGAQ